MEFIWLEDLVALAETGSFSRAAENRHVTQPAFSRRVRALEDWIGAPLFERGPHGVTLTATGEQFRTGAEELIRRVNQLRREAREAGGEQDYDNCGHQRNHPDDPQAGAVAQEIGGSGGDQERKEQRRQHGVQNADGREPPADLTEARRP